jgi:hypothetical protein
MTHGARLAARLDGTERDEPRVKYDLRRASQVSADEPLAPREGSG